MSKQSTPITPADASRIQSHADTTGRNQDFKARAQRAAAENTSPAAESHPPPPVPPKAPPQAPPSARHHSRTKR